MWLETTLQRWMGCLDPGAATGCQLQMQDGWLLLAALGVGWLGMRGGRRLLNAVYTLRAVALTPMLSRRLSMWVKRREYDEDAFFRADGAVAHWAECRKKALDRLAAYFQTKYAKSVACGNDIRESFSDLRFTDANRVPFPFMRVMREKFNLCSVVTASKGPSLRDLDGHWSLDVSGSYGVNVAGFERYKEWMRKGLERVRDMGPVLGPLHPLVADNIALLKSISGLAEVSFHMSGTEAVMAAVRLARFKPAASSLAFSGAYHGWWDGVQPGLGSERAISDCLTLKDMHPASLDVTRRRAKDIAGVLINPVQSFHPNAPPPSDAVLLTSTVRQTQDLTSDYARWLQLREVCRECDVPLIFDEVYSGFRLAPGGAQAYFGVQADMGAYGKTVAGMPIGVVCGARTSCGGLTRGVPCASPSHRHVFRPPGGHGGDVRVSQLAAQARGSVPLRGREAVLPDVGGRHQRRVHRTGPAAAGGQFRHYLDPAVQDPQPLQLAAAILLARRGRHPKLGGHGPLPEQPRFHPGRLR
jgi:glutamate-1-semialdehyde 2,1-aminomutase